MSTYLHLSNFDIVTEVYKRQQEAELFREKEFRAALRVQVNFFYEKLIKALKGKQLKF